MSVVAPSTRYAECAGADDATQCGLASVFNCQFMDISEEDVKEFQQLYKQEFDEDISYDAAKQRFSEILTLYQLLLRPTAKELEAME